MYSCLLFIHPCLLMKIYPMSLYSYSVGVRGLDPEQIDPFT